MSRPRYLIIFSFVFTLICGYLLADYYSGLPANVQANYVGRQACIDCHQEQFSLFHGSHHDLAMAIADETSVVADFNDQTLTHFGVTSRMYRDGDRYMVQTEGPDGELHDYEVKYTFGIEPLQQFMVEIEPPAESAKRKETIGRVQVLRLSWNTQENKWFYLMPPDVSEKLEPDDPLHWTGVTQNWNVSCAECHSTNLQKGFDVHSNRFATTFSEIDVSCESCHGPGSLHKEIAESKGIFWDRNHGFGLPDLKTESNVTQVESCAPCHARRTAVAEGFTAGCSFDDFYAVQTIQTPIYHIDGQIRDEDYVYGSFIQSKMYHKGIRCTDCHDPHSARLKHNGNLVCTSCHQHPSGKYDSPSHHFHKPGTEGAKCVNCHMPLTKYMEIDQRRDHSFRVPRPDLSIKLGTPNACTACHIDEVKLPVDEVRRPLKQYLDWIVAAEQGDRVIGKELDRVNKKMLDAVTKWYSSAITIPKTQYYEDLALGLAGQSNRLSELAKNATVPSIIRASAILGTRDSDKTFETALKTASNSDTNLAVASIRRLTGLLSIYSDRTAEAVQTIMPLLTHSKKQVRLEAVTFAMSIPVDIRNRHSSGLQRSAFQEGLKEYESYLRLNQDRPAGQIMLGGFFEQTRQIDRAKGAYERAIKMNHRMAGPRSRLANLLEAQASSPRSEGIDRLALSKQAQIYRAEEHKLLARDLKLAEELPENHILHYRFAMSCLLQKDYPLAKEHLLKCIEKVPNDENYLYATAAVFSDTGEKDKAKPFVLKLLKLDPGNPRYRQLAVEIE